MYESVTKTMNELTKEIITLHHTTKPSFASAVPVY